MFRRRRVTQYDVPPPPRRPLWWIWLVLLLVVVIGGITGVYFLTKNDATKSRVPNVVGLSASTATQRLGQRGYPVVVQRVSSDTRPGTVLSQSPAAGTALGRGGQVTITVARGRSAIVVPNVVGLADAEALVRLQAVGLKGRTVPLGSSQPKGRVVSQTPSGGREVRKGSTVSLSISSGPALITVPNVRGKTQVLATAQLSQIGFKVASTIVPATKPKGTVISQQPSGGTRAPKGSTVDLRVSNGPVSTNKGGKVPNVIGKSQRDAVAVLQNAGYQVDSSPVASSRPRGTVVSQTPPAGTRAPARSKVTIGVSLGSGPREPRTIPDVTGQAERTARQTLILAGFTVRTAERPATTPGDNGIVLDQKPAAGGSAPVGTQIVIYVGRLPSPTD
jgi:serine/threonine-protein kinase